MFIPWDVYVSFGHCVMLLSTSGCRILCRHVSSLSGAHLGVQVTWHLFHHEELPGCWPQRPYHVTLPPATHGAWRPASSLPLASVCPCDSGHPGGREVVTLSGSDVHFLITRDAEYIYTCLLVICVSSSERWQFEILYPFFNCLFTVILSETQI